MDTLVSYITPSEYIISIFPDGTSITREEKISSNDKPNAESNFAYQHAIVSFDEKVIGNIR